MYSTKPTFTYGFHGLDRDIAMQILNQEIDFKPSTNDYDWLGDGIYFWENNIERANQYAIKSSLRQGSTIKTPFALGTILDLGNCFDLLDQKYLDFLNIAYQELEKLFKEKGNKLPMNSSFGKDDFDFKKRELDCAVIRYAHQIAKESGYEFDSVRAAFWEGAPLYRGACFKRENHIQIAILNPDCIKGVFLPRDKTP